MPDPTLRNWRLISLEDGQDLAVFLGEVTDHPLLNDGWIITSPVQWISDDRSCARTRSRRYQLGDQFPSDQAMPEKPRNILFTHLITSGALFMPERWGALMAMADRLCGPLPPPQ